MGAGHGVGQIGVIGRKLANPAFLCTILLRRLNAQLVIRGRTSSVCHMPDELAISPCNSRREWVQFERVAECLHRSEPGFVPPFPGSIAKCLSKRSAFQCRHGEIVPFIARRAGRPVGRVAAIINHSHNKHHADRTGFFGFFESENDPTTASSLLRAAAQSLQDAGLTSIRGPYNPSINDECGLLAEGFGLPSSIGMTWNPEYYRALLVGEGFLPVRILRSMNLPMHRLQHPERLRRIVDRLTRRTRLTMRTMDITNLEKELEIVREVYNATLERNWGFVPISMDDLLGAAGDIRAIADPKLLLIAEMDGKDAGVAITLPNFNEILIRIKSTPHWLRLLHIFWLMKTQRIRSCRQTVLGVVPSCRDRGLHAWLIHEQFVRAQERYDNATLGWMEENNSEIIKNSQLVGGELDRHWEIFEKPLTPETTPV